ncbi:Transmembrane amino acid transporter domain containing protein [Naviculisporaceae sp. PSN 640]
MTGYWTFADATASSRSASGDMTAQQRRGRSPKLGGGHASIISSDINLINTIIGAGTLAMPFAMSHFGVALGVVLILWCGLTSAFGLYLQSRCARYMETGKASFFALSQLTYPGFGIVFDLAIAVKCFGVSISYLIIIGDLMPAIAKALGSEGTGWVFLDDRRFWITLFFLVFIIPSSFPKKLESLKYASMIALFSIGYLILLVAYHCAVDSRDERGDVNLITWDGPVAALSSLPLMIFGYTCHQNMFSIVNEIKDNSPKSLLTVIASSIGSAAAIYILVALTGYFTFGSNIQPNIIAMYPASLASTIGKAAIVALVLFGIPLQIHPCRNSIDAALRASKEFFSRRGRGNSGRASASSSSSGLPGNQPLLAGNTLTKLDSHGNPEVAMSDCRFAIITSGIIILSYLTALNVSSLGDVLAYVGATGSTTISFILPGWLYYKISDPKEVHHQRLTKEDDDADYSDSGSSSVGGDPEAGAPGPSRAAGLEASVGSLHSITGMVSSVTSRFRALQAKRNKGAFRWDLEHIEAVFWRRAALGLTIYGLVVMVVCLVTIRFFGGHH